MRRRRTLGLAAALALVLAAALVVRARRDDGGDAATAPATPVATQTAVLDGQPLVAAKPARRTDRVVVFFHGHGGSAQSLFVNGPRPALVAALVRAGYAVVASDAHGDAWGDDLSLDDYVRLIGTLRSQGYARVYLLAESMGGVASLRAAAQVRPKAWAGIYPVCDLGSMTAFASEIAAVWGGTVPASLSPVPVPAGLPVLAWASPQDTVVAKARNADVCAAGHVIATTGDHGDASNFQPARLVRFFDAHP